jgi:hypothetical protein
MILLLLAPLPALAAPVTFSWGSFSPSGSAAYGVLDSDNSTPLQTGDLVQLIYAGANGIPDPPNADGLPGGDDELLQTSAVQNGMPFPPPMRGLGYIPSSTFTFDDADLRRGGWVYIRAWNGPTPQEATAWGESDSTRLEPEPAAGVFNVTGWSTGLPTAVELASFTAAASDGAIRLAWETASEIDLAGFNIRRAEAFDGQYFVINAALIQAKSFSNMGASYTYDDVTASPGVTCYYRLEEVDTHGHSRFYGPVWAAAGLEPAQYLPLVVR